MRKLLLMITLACALASLYGAVVSAPAGAAGIPPADADCSAHGRLTHHYSPSELRSAQAKMPADIAQYTNCPAVIRSALLSEIGPIHANGNSSGGGSFLPAWVIAVLIVLLLGAAGLAAVAMRNRRRAP